MNDNPSIPPFNIFDNTRRTDSSVSSTSSKSKHDISSSSDNSSIEREVPGMYDMSSSQWDEYYNQHNPRRLHLSNSSSDHQCSPSQASYTSNNSTNQEGNTNQEAEVRLLLCNSFINLLKISMTLPAVQPFF